MDHFAAGAGGAVGEIAFFAEVNRKASTLRIAGDTGAVNAATDNKDVVMILSHALESQN
jgi:hypothetical protein